MSIQRWDISCPTQWRAEDAEGEWVTYADHVAAVAVALDSVREAVAARPPHSGSYAGWLMEVEVFDAIDALRIERQQRK